MGSFTSGNNGSSRFLDLDPNNIESVNVLKGLAAATLYGSEGRNGVILITTKSGTTSFRNESSKNEITVNTSYFVNEIAMKPDYQNQYGNGFNQNFGWFFQTGVLVSTKKVQQVGEDSLKLMVRYTALSGQPGLLKHPYVSNLNARFLARDLLPLLGLSMDSMWEWKPYDSIEDLIPARKHYQY